LDKAADLAENANLWRISGDFWDDWNSLKRQFALCRVWAPYIAPNHWPDADMLPLGRLRIRGYEDPERQTRFTPAEQRTHLTLWAILRSPLMMGGDLPTLDAATLDLLNNSEMIAVDQDSTHNRELFTRGNQVAWVADIPGSPDHYLAIFNLDDRAPAEIIVRWGELGSGDKFQVRDLWERKSLGVVVAAFAPTIVPHGAGLYRITPVK
jgi:hypothetical protein